MYRRFRQGLVVSAVTAAGAAALGTAATPAFAAQPRVRVGSAAALSAGTHVIGRTPRTEKIHFDVALAPRDPLALKRYATAVATPDSRVFGDDLTVPQFAHRFGSTPAHLAAVRAELRREGLHVAKPAANHLTLHVTGSAAKVERALAVSLRRVRTAAGRVTDTDTTAPTLPAAVAPWVQGIVGLDDTTLVRPSGVEHLRHHSSLLNPDSEPSPGIATNGGPQPCTDATDTAEDNEGSQTADGIATAYGFPAFYQQGDLGQNQHVALIELGQQYSPTDIAQYQSCYGTDTPVNAIQVDGGPPTTAGSDESELDIEILIGMAPQATVDVYQTSTATSQDEIDALTAVVSANVDKVISLSYGSCEQAGDPANASEQTLLQEAASQGQTFLASTGDQGSVCDPSTTGLSVNDPASDPYATAVGGTTLYGGGTNSAGTSEPYTPGGPVDQAVWNDGTQEFGAPSGTGGGISTLFAMPTYQSGAAALLGVTAGGSGAPCASTTTLCREIPDVSADADPNSGYVTYINDPTSPGNAGGWGIVGGTSAAAPLWASYVALSDNLPGCAGKTLGFLNPSLYQLAGLNYSGNFQDVTAGTPFDEQGVAVPASNDALGTNNGSYPVKPGYDMTTGLGTMTAGLGGSLCSVHPAVTIATPGPVAAVVGTPLALTVAASDSQGEALTYAATGLPAGLVINPATGAISGTPTTAGAATVTVTATDTTGIIAATAPFAVTVTTPPPPTKPAPTKKKQPATNQPIGVTLTGLTKGKLSFSFGWDVAKGSKSLTGIEVKLPKGLSFGGIKGLRKGVVIKAGGKAVAARAHFSKRVLTLTFKKKTTKLALVIRKPALKITRTEVKQIKQGKVKKLEIKVIGISKQKQIARTVTIRKLR